MPQLGIVRMIRTEKKGGQKHLSGKVRSGKERGLMRPAAGTTRKVLHHQIVRENVLLQTRQIQCHAIECICTDVQTLML